MGEKEMPKTHSVKINFIMNAILKMSAFLFPLITFPYTSRVLGASGNGKLAFAASVISYFSMISQLGIPTYGTRVCAACRNDIEKLNKTVQELLILNSVTVIISYAALCVCMLTIPRLQDCRVLLIISSTTILLGAVGMDWFFNALEMYGYITIRNLAFKFLAIILMFIFVHKPEDFIIYGAINVLGSCGSNILNIIYSRRFLLHKKYNHYNIKQHLKPVMTFFMLTVSVSIYTSMDSVMLGFISGDTEVGYYSAATKMKMILVNTVTALGTVLLPRMSNYAALGKWKAFNDMIRKSFNFIFVISIPLTLYFSVMSDAVIGFLAGDGYAGAVIPMQIITWTLILISLSNITGMQILVPTNRENITTLSTVVGAVVNLIVNAVMIPGFGAAGAAIGTVIAEISVLLFQVLYLKHDLKPMLKGIQIWKILLANGISVTGLIIVNMNLGNIIHFWRLFITACVFFGLYGVTLLITREAFFMNYGIKTLENIWKK